MASVKRQPQPVPPPPPDKVIIELDIEEAQGLFTLLWKGTEAQTVRKLSLDSLMRQLDGVCLQVNSVNFIKYATEGEFN